MTWKIRPWYNAQTGETQVRADFFGPHGQCSKTCATQSEAMAFINVCKNRKPCK